MGLLLTVGSGANQVPPTKGTIMKKLALVAALLSVLAACSTSGPFNGTADNDRTAQALSTTGGPD